MHGRGSASEVIAVWRVVDTQVAGVDVRGELADLAVVADPLSTPQRSEIDELRVLGEDERGNSSQNDRQTDGGCVVAVMLTARFDGDVRELITAYDRAHALIMSRGGATGVGERRHYCATDESSLYIIGVWESEELLRARWGSKEFKETLTSFGFPSPSTAHLTVLALHATEPPLELI